MPRMKLLAALLFPLSFLSAQPNPEQMKKAHAEVEKLRRQAVATNELAGNLKTPADARKLVDTIADLFADALPPKWVTGKVRERLAMAEYQSVHDAEKLIPEERIADAWNRYATEIGAPPEALVTAAEVHYLRDAAFTSRRFFWAQGNQTIWTMPNIYAVGPDGKVGRDARVLEALSIVRSLADDYEVVQGAHDAVKKGYLFSDHFRPPREGEKFQGRMSVRAVTRTSPVVAARTNPVEDAEIRYTRERGELAMAGAIGKLVMDLLPE